MRNGLYMYSADCFNSKPAAPTAHAARRFSHCLSRRRPLRPCCSAAQVKSEQERAFTLHSLTIRQAEREEELLASAKLRIESFYKYPEGRGFAAERHQAMKIEEEYEALQQQLAHRRAQSAQAAASGRSQAERSACMVAAVASVCFGGGGSGGTEAAVQLGLHALDGGEVLVGTLDLYAVRAMPGEVLIGDCRNPAYLANVCVAAAAQRQGIGRRLIECALAMSRDWGVESLFVHILWVNTEARAFYESLGFHVDKEESSNTAHYRGHCLEGIEGRGRTLLLRNDLDASA